MTYVKRILSVSNGRIVSDSDDGRLGFCFHACYKVIGLSSEVEELALSTAAAAAAVIRKSAMHCQPGHGDMLLESAYSLL